MSLRFRRFTKKGLFFLNVFTVIVFLVACLVPYLNPARWWFISLSGLIFPFLLLAVVLFFIFWIFVKPKFVLVSAIALIAGVKNVSLLFALHTQPAFSYIK